MATVLAKPLSRELEKFPGLIVTVTPNGITFKVKRKQRNLEVTWEEIFGAAAMVGTNKETLIDASKVALKEVGYNGDSNDS